MAMWMICIDEDSMAYDAFGKCRRHVCFAEIAAGIKHISCKDFWEVWDELTQIASNICIPITASAFSAWPGVP